MFTRRIITTHTKWEAPALARKCAHEETTPDPLIYGVDLGSTALQSQKAV